MSAKRDDDEASFEGLVSFGTVPPPPGETGDVHNALTTVAALPDSFLDELKAGVKQEVRARGSSPENLPNTDLSATRRAKSFELPPGASPPDGELSTDGARRPSVPRPAPSSGSAIPTIPPPPAAFAEALAVSQHASTPRAVAAAPLSGPSPLPSTPAAPAAAPLPPPPMTPVNAMSPMSAPSHAPLSPLSPEISFGGRSSAPPVAHALQPLPTPAPLSYAERAAPASTTGSIPAPASLTRRRIRVAAVLVAIVVFFALAFVLTRLFAH